MNTNYISDLSIQQESKGLALKNGLQRKNGYSPVNKQ